MGGKEMVQERLHPELERRIALLESKQNQGDDYDGAAWLALIGLGIVLPIIALWLAR
jgi:hypothetical protein